MWLATIGEVTAKPKATSSKQKKPRAKRGEILDEFDRWSRHYLYLTEDERCFGYRDDSLYREIDVREVFDWAVGRTEVWWSIPRYTELLEDAESDGLNA
jgi:hypothetical protein